MYYLKIITLFTICSSSVVNSKRYSLNSLTLERKPFASPEQPAVLQSYKRTKRQTRTKTAQEFQDFLSKSKETCGAELGFSKEQLEKSLLYSENMTQKEKCLVACILKRSKIMDKTNKLSTRSIGRIAEIVSNSNALVVSIAMATAENCNRNVRAAEPCEAAYQINKCIANEMKTHKVKIAY